LHLGKCLVHFSITSSIICFGLSSLHTLQTFFLGYHSYFCDNAIWTMWYCYTQDPYINVTKKLTLSILHNYNHLTTWHYSSKHLHKKWEHKATSNTPFQVLSNVLYLLVFLNYTTSSYYSLYLLTHIFPF